MRGAYLRETRGTFVLIGIQGTPIAVRRGALAGEEWRSGATPPQPNQTPFSVGGRLLSAQDGPAYQQALTMLASFGELPSGPSDLWILIEGDRPSSKLFACLTSAATFLFLLANGALLWRGIAERLGG